PAEAIADALDQPLARRGVADVGLDVVHRRTEPFQRFHWFAHVVGATLPAHHQVESVPGERFGDAEADPPGAAGDERYSLHRSLSLHHEWLAVGGIRPRR